MSKAAPARPRFFATPAYWRAWLEAHHATEGELVVGYHKKGSGTPSITWPESVDEALCFGWIDGVRRSIDEARYQIRFTPRKPGSRWSLINIARVEALTNEGRMRPAGLAAFAKRAEARSGTYSFEQTRETCTMPPAAEEQLAANAKAWAFWKAQPPGYQRVVAWWIVSAKKEETRARRLATLCDDCAHGRRIKQFVSPVPAWKKR